jgi:hypothetical protein
MKIHNPFRFIFFIIGAVVVVGYSLFTARFFIAGPQLEVDNPEYIETSEPLITISGTSSHIQALWVNGHEVFLEEGGIYRDTRILTPGLSYITLLAKDRFDRTEKKIITAYYNKPFEAPIMEEREVNLGETDSTEPETDTTEPETDTASSVTMNELTTL